MLMPGRIQKRHPFGIPVCGQGFSAFNRNTILPFKFLHSQTNTSIYRFIRSEFHSYYLTTAVA